MPKTRYTQIGQAELKVDCYAGKSMDQHKPEWHGFFEGDRDGGKIGHRITLDASRFRPGTRVLIQEPVCPQCDAAREMCELDEDCDFNWRAWDEEQYA